MATLAGGPAGHQARVGAVMAAAVGIAAAEKLAETVLPLLLERLKPDGKEAAAAAGTKTYDQASAMLPTARKCAELLSKTHLRAFLDGIYYTCLLNGRVPSWNRQ